MDSKNFIRQDLSKSLGDNLWKQLLSIRDLPPYETSHELSSILHHELRDTNRHQLQIARAVREYIGPALRIPPAYVYLINLAASLHDAGKLGAKKEVTKAEDLTDEDLKKIKKHPVIGAKILRMQRFSTRVVAAAMLHHARQRPNSYPSYEEIVESQCFSQGDLEVIFGEYFQRPGASEICLFDNYITVNGMRISAVHMNQIDIWLGIYAADMITMLDQTEPLVNLRQYNSRLATVPLRERMEGGEFAFGNVVQRSTLPRQFKTFFAEHMPFIASALLPEQARSSHADYLGDFAYLPSLELENAIP